ncbi:MAG: hypothetical protein KGH94_03330 [Candidatus Micrarchaeota archaeon]|nr:hypothetical protein [Candidatus Micrarchaeota archaeon]
MMQPELLRSGDRKRIGMDIDGTLALFHETFIKEYNLRYNSAYAVKDFYSYNKWGIPVSFKEFSEMHDQIWKARWWDVLPAVSAKTLDKLAQNHDLEILTHRPRDHEGPIREWMDFYFPGVKSKIKITDTTQEKAHAKYDVLFDDAPPVAEELIKKGDTSTLLFFVTRPWNQNEHHELKAPNIIRVASLTEGIDLFSKEGNRVQKPSRQKSKLL